MFKIVRSAIAPEDAINAQHQWPVELTATYSDGEFDANIFVMQATTDDEFGAAEFSCVASAVQMFDLPVDAPSSEGPFYRAAQVSVLCRSAVAAEEFIEKVYGAAGELATNINAASNLSEVDTVTILPDAQ